MAQLAGIKGYIWTISQCSIQSEPPLESRANAHVIVASTCVQRYNKCLFMVSFSSRESPVFFPKVWYNRNVVRDSVSQKGKKYPRPRFRSAIRFPGTH